jgi:hypothetical protein
VSCQDSTEIKTEQKAKVSILISEYSDYPRIKH